MQKNNRMIELDALRGLAALAVVLYHFSTRYNEIYGHAKNNYFLDFKRGYLGVELFFMISGFVIFLSLIKCASIKDFIVKRFIRLYPAYIFAVILTFAFTSIYNLPGRTVELEAFLFNLTMLQGFFFIPHVDGVYWTLTVELSFYIIIGSIFAMSLLKKIELVSIAWLIISFILKVLSLKFGSTFLYIFFIPDYSHLFIAGIMFYKIKSEPKLINHLIIFICLIYQIGLNPNIDSIFIAFFFLLFYFLIFGKKEFLHIKPLQFLGNISFSLYLLHQNIGYIIILTLEKYGYTNETFILIPVTITVLLAALITYSLEKPLQELLLTRYKKRKKVFLTSHN